MQTIVLKSGVDIELEDHEIDLLVHKFCWGLHETSEKELDTKDLLEKLRSIVEESDVRVREDRRYRETHREEGRRLMQHMPKMED